MTTDISVGVRWDPLNGQNPDNGFEQVSDVTFMSVCWSVGWYVVGRSVIISQWCGRKLHLHAIIGALVIFVLA